MKQEIMRILSNKEIAKNIFEMKLSESIQKEIKEPGQFLHIKVPDESMILRRPISIASYNDDSLTILYKLVGCGTKLIAKLKEGATLDILGPLGNGFKIESLAKESEILIIGAGIGIAPLYELSKKLHDDNHKLKIVLSYISKEESYYIEKFKALGNVHISTDDGSCGMKGYCEDLVKTLNKDYDFVYACGPSIVLKFVQQYFRDLDNVYLSLEQRMGCGIGACHACDTKDKKKRICKDGPVFNAHEVEI